MMPASSKRPLLLAVSWLLLGLPTLFLLSCERKPPTPTRVDAAVEAVQRMIDNMRANPTGSKTQAYLIRAYEQGLKTVGTPAPAVLENPVLLSGEFSFVKTKLGLRPSLTIHWLEDGFDAAGVYIVSAEGTEYEFDGLFAWNADDRRWFQPSVWRDTWIPVVYDDATVEMWEQRPGRWRSIRIPKTLLKGELRVGLLLKGGNRTAAVPLHVPPSGETVGDENREGAGSSSSTGPTATQ